MKQLFLLPLLFLSLISYSQVEANSDTICYCNSGFTAGLEIGFNTEIQNTILIPSVGFNQEFIDSTWVGTITGFGLMGLFPGQPDSIQRSVLPYFMLGKALPGYELLLLKVGIPLFQDNWSASIAYGARGTLALGYLRLEGNNLFTLGASFYFR